MLCLIVVIFTINAVTDGFDHKDPSISTDANVQFALKTKEKYLRRNGTSYIFDCSVENYKAVSENIEWVKDGETIPYYNGMVKVQYQGERNSTLVVPNATNRDAGLYTCTVVNFLRKEISRTFELPPTGKPFIYVPIGKEDLTIEEGSNAKFKCVVSGNFTAWRWLYNGNLVTTTVRKKLRPAYFLKIRKVRKDDEGIYVCSVTNKFGTSQKFYTLKVKSKKRKAPKKPQLVKNYTSLPEIVMNDLDVDCSVVGALPMNVTWYKDGIPISSLQRKKGFIFRENKQILRLETLLPEDRANYTCYFQNRYGSLKHTIEVEPIEKAHTAPYFVGKKNQETPYYVRPDQDLNVTVEVVVFNTAHFQLLLHYNLTNSTSNQTEQGLRVLSTPRDIILLRPETNRVANDAFRYKLNFKFKNLTKEDFAFYSIMAGNTFGYDVYQFQLADENERVAPITDADRNSQKKSMYKTSTFIIIISLSIGFVVIFVIACILWRHKSKRSFTNNNKFFWKETNVELVHLNIEDSATVTTASRRMKYSSSRLSSCQTEKEYFSNLSVDPNWEVDFENIEFRGFIGEGAFGRVMLANVHGLPETKEPTVAAVKMLKEDATEHELKDLLSEMQVMKNIGKHINIVNLLGVSTQQGKLCVIIEYCLFGNLRNYLKERRPTVAPNPPPIEQLCLFHLTSFCLQVAKGMEYLASQKCVHRDIAARNILVSDNHIVKIADFGLARDVQLTDYYRKCTDGRLPVKWMAMEALFDRVYTVQSDIWSFGILAWEVVTLGGSPYPGVPLEKLFDLLKQGYRMEKPVNCTENMYKLMLKCWKEEPRKRPSFTELIDDLENMITDVSGIEYLDLQPPIVGLHCAESVSSNSQGQSCGRTSVNSADVFEENAADDDTVQADKGEEDRLLNESQVAADT